MPQVLGVGQVGPNPIATNRVGTTTQNAVGIKRKKSLQVSALERKLSKGSVQADKKLVD